jgi:hypothetical protein
LAQAAQCQRNATQVSGKLKMEHKSATAIQVGKSIFMEAKAADVSHSSQGSTSQHKLLNGGSM